MKSDDLQFHNLIHHFACAHVNDSAKFETENGIQCPKCLCNDLVAGADFELIRSHYNCRECRSHEDATVDVGCCLNCNLRFPLELASESEVYAYDVQRLDILAFVDTARQAVVVDSTAAVV